MRDTIYREYAIEVLAINAPFMSDEAYLKSYDALESIPSADRPNEVIYGNEHNCIMTMFGECSYAETGCGDCAVVEKVRKALSADRPQGEWIEVTNGRGGHECSNCHDYAPSYMNGDEHLSDFCPQCGARMKGADDE